MRKWSWIVGLLVATTLANTHRPAQACGFDGGLGSGFSAMHPRSMTVAFAIRDAVKEHVMPNSVLEPIVPGAAGYWRAAGRLNELTTLLSAAAQDQPDALPAISVVFIDSSLWSRITAGADGLRIEVHAKGAQPGDIVIVTSESVLAEVLAERMSIAAALARDVIAIDGERDDADRVRNLLSKALDPPAVAPLRDVPQPTVRFFGSKH